VIEYDRTAWWRVVFSFAGTVLPRVLPRVGLLTGSCLALCLVDEYGRTRGLDFRGAFALDQLGHTVLGTALGLFVVFRTNSAHARYWEARTLWGGIVNASRNLVRVAAAHAGPADDLARLAAAFPRVLKQTLRGSKDFAEVRGLLPGGVYEALGKAADPPGAVTRAMAGWVRGRLAGGRLHPIQAAQLDGLIGTLVDCQGGCERILRTPLPFVYAALIKQILLIYLATLPFVLVAKMGFAAPVAVAVVALGLLGIEEAGVEIENPFDPEPNNLPLDKFCETVARSVAEAAAEG